MTDVTPCLWFAADAEEAVRFYVSVVPDSGIDHIQLTPPGAPAGPAGAVLMIAFRLAGRPYLALNGGMKVDPGLAVSFSVGCADQAEIDRIWAAFADGGKEESCGWVRDRWGYPWQIVPANMMELLAGPPEKSARVFAALLSMVKLDKAALERAAAG